MTRYGGQFGPDLTFLGVPQCDLDDPATYADADVVILGACYLAHDGSRPSLALRTVGLKDLRVVDGGDVEMFSGDAARSCADLEVVVQRVAETGAMPLILGGDHTITWPDVTGVARARGWGRVAVIHFDAHADTGDIEFGSLIGHGQPMRRLIESGAARGDRFLQIGLRGYWPPPDVLEWMAQQRMRSYEMTEIVTRGLVDRVADERFSGIALDASDEAAVAEACRAYGITHVLNVVDPRFNMPIFDGAFAAGAHYLDTAMSLSRPHPERPHSDAFVKLGDEQFAKSDAWAERGLLALLHRDHRRKL